MTVVRNLGSYLRIHWLLGSLLSLSLFLMSQQPSVATVCPGMPGCGPIGGSIYGGAMGNPYQMQYMQMVQIQQMMMMQSRMGGGPMLGGPIAGSTYPGTPGFNPNAPYPTGQSPFTFPGSVYTGGPISSPFHQPNYGPALGGMPAIPNLNGAIPPGQVPPSPGVHGTTNGANW